jgi:hypothetical protein
MKLPRIKDMIDERFLEHRRRSTSAGAMAGALVAYGLFMYRYIADDVVSWDLFAVLAAMVVVKLTLLAWYRIKD